MTNHQQPTADDHRKRQLTLPFERAEQAAQLRQRILAGAKLPNKYRRLLLAIAAHPSPTKSDRARALCIASLRELMAALQIPFSRAARIRLQRLINRARQQGWLRTYANFRTFAGQHAGQKPNVYRICYARLRRLPDQRTQNSAAEAEPAAPMERHLRQPAASISRVCPPGTRNDGIVCPPGTDFSRQVCPPFDRNFADFPGGRGTGARPPARINQKQENTTTTTTRKTNKPTWGFRVAASDLTDPAKVRRLFDRAVAQEWLDDSPAAAEAFLALVFWLRDQPGYDPVVNPKGIRSRPGWLLWAITGDDWRGWAEPAHWTRAARAVAKFLHPDERSTPDAK